VVARGFGRLRQRHVVRRIGHGLGIGKAHPAILERVLGLRIMSLGI
jgi:hypothetical protein